MSDGQGIENNAKVAINGSIGEQRVTRDDPLSSLLTSIMCGSSFRDSCFSFDVDNAQESQLSVLSNRVNALKAIVETIAVTGMVQGETYGAFTSADGQQNEFSSISCCPSAYDIALAAFEVNWAESV
jgi:hypothetical protein